MPHIKFEYFKSICQNKGIKATTQRYFLYLTLCANPVHPTADQLYEMVRPLLSGLGRDTVYRTLNLLTDYGFINKLGSSGAGAHYDANMKPHHHFICNRCGAIHDFIWPEFDHLKWPDEIYNIGENLKSAVHFSGICRKCRGIANV